MWPSTATTLNGRVLSTLNNGQPSPPPKPPDGSFSKSLWEKQSPREETLQTGLIGKQFCWVVLSKLVVPPPLIRKGPIAQSPGAPPPLPEPPDADPFATDLP